MFILPQNEAWSSKDCRVWNIIMCGNGKVDSLYSGTLKKNSDYIKNSSNKNCSELKCLIFPWSGSRGSKDCRVWNIIMYGNRKVDSLWEQNTAKNIDFSKTSLEVKLQFFQNLLEITSPKFLQNSSQNWYKMFLKFA